MTEPVKLPRFQCHKIVEAARIIAILRDTSEIVVDTWSSTATIFVGFPWIDRHNPKIGGYYVRYEGGYASYSPADAFEIGYRLIEENKTMQVPSAVQEPPQAMEKGVGSIPTKDPMVTKVHGGNHRFRVRDSGFAQCHYCGSLHGLGLMTLLDNGASLECADMKYGWPHKLYVQGDKVPGRQMKFYTEHLKDLSPEDFARVRKAIEGRTGIRFSLNDAGRLTFEIRSRTGSPHDLPPATMPQG